MKAAPQLTTLLFVVMWYGLNVAFNLLNKTIFNYFPFPYTVSAVHVVVGLLYCSVAYLVGAKKASFGRVSMPASGFPDAVSVPCALHAVCPLQQALPPVAATGMVMYIQTRQEERSLSGFQAASRVAACLWLLLTLFFSLL